MRKRARRPVFTRAQRTYFAAMARPDRRPADLRDTTLPEKVLHPDESVLEVVVGTLKNDNFPVLIVTDRRVIKAKNRIIRGWAVMAEAPLTAVVQAARRHHWLTEEVIVSVQGQRQLKMRTNRPKEADRAVAVLQRIMTGSVPRL